MQADALENNADTKDARITFDYGKAEYKVPDENGSLHSESLYRKPLNRENPNWPPMTVNQLRRLPDNTPILIRWLGSSYPVRYLLQWIGSEPHAVCKVYNNYSALLGSFVEVGILDVGPVGEIGPHQGYTMVWLER